MSPIFGVLAEPSGQGANTTFIVSSYVKWLESGGARVVPIRYDAPQCEVDFLMHRVNGIVLPGGVTSISPTHDYGQFAHRVLKKAMGRRIPVWGTCLGHELIMRDTCYDAGEPNPVQNVPSEGFALPLTFTAEASSSDFYRSLPQDVRRGLATSNLTINLHTYGVPSETFRASKALTSAFHLVATSTDTLGKEFVALTQHVTLPIVTTQFHIEKNPYEFQEGHYDGADGSGMAPPHSPAACAPPSRWPPGWWARRAARTSHGAAGSWRIGSSGTGTSSSRTRPPAPAGSSSTSSLRTARPDAPGRPTPRASCERPGGARAGHRTHVPRARAVRTGASSGLRPRSEHIGHAGCLAGQFSN